MRLACFACLLCDKACFVPSDFCLECRADLGEQLFARSTPAREIGPGGVLLVNLSGRGDKDVHTVEKSRGR